MNNIKENYDLFLSLCKKKQINIFAQIPLIIHNLSNIINIKDHVGGCGLLYACYYNNIIMTEIILDNKNVNINITDNYGNTPLMIACLQGNYDIVHLLLQYHHINIYKQNKKGETCCLMSCLNNHTNITKLLINTTNGKCLLQSDMHNNTCIRYICYNNNYSLLEYIIQNNIHQNVNFNEQNTLYGDTPFIIACKYNYTHIVQLLFDYHLLLNINFNIQDFNGNTGFITACMYNNVEIIKLLLLNNQYIDINIINNANENGFMNICKCNNIELIDYIIHQNININYNQYSIHYDNCIMIAYKYEHYTLFQYLIENVINNIISINLNHEDKEKNNIFIYICKIGHLELLKLLCENNYFINMEFKKFIFGLYSALVYKHLDIIKYLLHLKYADKQIIKHEMINNFLYINTITYDLLLSYLK